MQRRHCGLLPTGQQFRAMSRQRRVMQLTLIAGDPESIPDNSPTLYKTDRGSWVVQGWVVSDPEALAALHVPEGETRR
jgi:hypothetical protein